jgi:hypothetical protein
LTTLPQGATNLVGQFCRITKQIVSHQFKHSNVYVDDLLCGGPKTTYNNELSELPGVRRAVLEHLMMLDILLANVERAGATIAGTKFDICVEGVTIVGYYCNRNGQNPDASKVAAIMKWETPRSLKSARDFIGICVYYRLWIPGFALVANQYSSSSGRTCHLYGDQNKLPLCVLCKQL